MAGHVRAGTASESGRCELASVGAIGTGRGQDRLADGDGCNSVNNNVGCDIELCAHLKSAWAWEEEDTVAEEGRSGGHGHASVGPDVEDLARWMVDNEDWLPKPMAGAAGRTTTTIEQAEAAWKLLPEGLKVWCTKFEPEMFKAGAEVLGEFERLVDEVDAHGRVSGAESGTACPAAMANNRSASGKAGDRDSSMPTTTCASADAERAWAPSSTPWLNGSRERGGPAGPTASGAQPDQHTRPPSAGPSVSPSAAPPVMPEYAPWRLRHAILKAMVARGMRPQECLFVMEERFGIPDEFGKARYAWDANRRPLQWVLSIADKFVTMMMGDRRPRNLRWDPIARIIKADDWRAGGVHEPEAAAAWAGLHGVSSWVLDWVRNKFYAEPEVRVPSSVGKNASYLDPGHHSFDADKFAFADAKLAADDKLGVLERMGPTCQPDVVNRVGLAPKKSVTEPWRLYGDMRPINKCYKNRKMKYETVRHVPTVIDEGDLMWVCDQRAAYHSVFVQERLARQFGIQWRGIYRKWKSLPFGFVLSPWCFAKMMRQVVKHWRAMHRKLLQFLDDGLGANGLFVVGTMQRNEHIMLLHSLGFRCSDKSSPLLEQTKVFLGMVLHLAAEVPTYHVPHEKVAVLEQMMDEAVHELDAWTMRKVAKIAGKLLSMSLAIPATRLMSRELYACMRSNRAADWDGHIASTPGALAELRWLIRCLAPWNHEGYPIWVDTKVTDFDITADASPTAGGFKIVETQSARIAQLSTVLFRPEESELSQCHREFWILCLLVRGMARQLRGSRIRVRVDAITTQAYWRNCGGASVLLTNMTKLLWATCVRNRITIVDVVHIPGTQMVMEHVDALSRPVPTVFGTEADREEWRLEQGVFEAVQLFFGVRFTVDRFASRINTRCARFNAKQWEPEAIQPPSAFAHAWGEGGPEGAEEYNFCHPPLRLVPHAIHHARASKAWVCFVVPRWPSQPWWPALMHGRSAPVYFVGRGGDTLARLDSGRWQLVRRPPFELVAVVCDFRAAS